VGELLLLDLRSELFEFVSGLAVQLDEGAVEEERSLELIFEEAPLPPQLHLRQLCLAAGPAVEQVQELCDGLKPAKVGLLCVIRGV
jgi:hypothetical protein